MTADNIPAKLIKEKVEGSKPPEVTLPFDIKSQANEVLQFVDQNILGHLPPYLHELAKHSILTQRRIHDNSPIQLATTESIREQILSQFTDSSGLVNEDKKNSFFKRLGNGYVYALDGVRLQAVSSYSELVGNAYIVGNNEVILKAAKKLKCEVLPGIYSGDENLPLFFESENHQGEPLTADSIQRAIAEASNEYYRTDPLTSPYWKQVQEVMTYNLPEEEKHKLLGLDGEIRKISDTKIRKQIRVSPEGKIAEQTLRERSLMGAIIDAVNPSESSSELITTTSQDLLDGIENTLAQLRTIHLEDPRYLNHGETQKRWPKAVKDMHEQAVSGLDKQFENNAGKGYQDLPEYQSLLKQIHAFAELSVCEPLFSGSLEVRKIQ